jgi:sRNA-binding carbon storage regulator CsrA
MLVLSRRKDERITITVTEPTTFELVLVSTQQGKVRIGFEADPKTVCISRPDAIKTEPKKRA